MTLTALAKYLVSYATRADATFASVERLSALGLVCSEAALHSPSRNPLPRPPSTADDAAP